MAEHKWKGGDVISVYGLAQRMHNKAITTTTPITVIITPTKRITTIYSYPFFFFEMLLLLWL